MIRFFRSLRKKLIEQDNVRKYLLYAIGEIALVMIGILLALQVNNWNEERKIKENERLLLSDVMEALHSDSLQLEELSALMDSTFMVYNQLYIISEGMETPASIRNPDNIRSSASGRPVSKANYPDLASKVVDNDLKKKVLEYYQVLIIWDYIIEEYNRFIEGDVRPFLAENELLIYSYHFENPDPEDRFGKIDIEKLAGMVNEPKIQQKLFEAAQKTRNYIGLYPMILSERADLINEIERVMGN